MTDDSPAANEPRNPAAPAADVAQPDPPREPRWRPFVKPFLITLAFTVVLDLGTRLVASPAAEQTVKSFGQSVEYGLESVNVFAMLRRAGARVNGDRYHTSVANWKTPFNLSEACRNGDARNGVYGIEVSNLCSATPPPPLLRDPREIVFAPVIPVAPRSPVDATKYPRSELKEYLLGLPDAVRHTLACAWDGKDLCGAASAGQTPRSNWFGKLLLAAAAIFSLAVTLSSDQQPRQGEAPKAFSFVVIFFMSLLYAGMACAVLLLVLKGLAALGLWLSGVLAALAGFPVAAWVFAALKDLAADQVKGYAAKKI